MLVENVTPSAGDVKSPPVEGEAPGTASSPTPTAEANSFRRLWELGYRRLLPIIPPGAPISPKSTLFKRLKPGRDPRGKTPGEQWASGDWSSFRWTDKEADEDDLHRWNGMGAGVGIKTGDLGNGLSLVVIDADTTDRQLAETIHDAVENTVGKLPIRIGRDPKAGYLVLVRGAFPYTLVEFGSGGSRERVEILSDGRQFVAHGIHPVTQKPYHWPQGIPAMADIPIVEVADLNRLMGLLRETLPGAGEVHRENSASSSKDAPDPETLRGDITTVRKAVEALPNTSALFPDRDSYIAVGFAIKAALPDDGAEAFEIFSTWCDRWEDDPSGKLNDPDEVQSDWFRMRPPFRRGASWLYDLAAKHSGGKFTRAEQWHETYQEPPPKPQDLFPDDPEGSPPGRPSTGLTFDDLDGLTVITAEELSDIPDREFILGSRMQPGLLTIGVGPPGASKSTFAILSALAIASGKPLTGEYVAKSGPVLVYTAEDPRAEMLRRYSAVARRHGLDVDAMLKRVRILSGYDGRRLVFAERRERNGPIRPGPDVEVLADFVRERGIVHVALDPLISLHRGLDENSSSDMEALGDLLRDFAKRSGASVDLIHHTVKNRTGQAEQNAGVADSSRGSGAVIGFVRSAYTLTPMGDSTGQALGLPRERTTQMVRLDDAKRNYGRRAARERWFELMSVLPSGVEVAALDFEATDPAIVRRALSSVGVHIIFDANRQRALQNLAKGDDDAERAATLRSYIVSSMETDWIERPVLTGMMSIEMKMGETTARKTIDDIVPAQRNRAVPVEANGLIYDVWREKRKIGSQWTWSVCRQLTGQVVRDEPITEPEDEALEGAFG